jgi:glutamine cyclotransferase
MGDGAWAALIFRFLSQLLSFSASLFLVAAVGVLAAAQDHGNVPGPAYPGSCPEPRVQGIRIVRVLPHDPEAFTQGLAWDGGFLYEGTGLHGRSTLRKVDPATGRVLRLHRLEGKYFGEGIAVAGGRIVQLTWRSGTGFIYEKASFREAGRFSYPGEGWGITFDGRRFIMSDGSPRLRCLDPRTFRRVATIQVRSGGRPLSRLNELEYVNGRILANIWGSDRIAVISPRSGCVETWLDLSPLREQVSYEPRAEALNGIAYDRAGDRLFVTGKHWPKMFVIKASGIGR